MEKQEFKLIVAGGKSFDDAALMDREIRKVVAELPDHYSVSIVTNASQGGGALAYAWTTQNQCTKYVVPVDWQAHKKRGSMISNVEMASQSQGLIAFSDGSAKEIEHLIVIAQNLRIEFIRVIPYGLSTKPTMTYRDGVLIKMQE